MFSAEEQHVRMQRAGGLGFGERLAIQLATVQHWRKAVELSVLNSSQGSGETYGFEGEEGHTSTRSILRNETLQEDDT